MPPKYGSFGVVFLVVPQNDNFLASLNTAVVLVGRAIAIKEAERGGSIGAATPDSFITVFSFSSRKQHLYVPRRSRATTTLRS
jgi:hypothetical protein